jgi:hypothetical protein
MNWHEYDHHAPGRTSPPAFELVWMADRGSGVILGYFDGIAFREAATRSDDVDVTHWAQVSTPAPPDAKPVRETDKTEHVYKLLKAGLMKPKIMSRRSMRATLSSWPSHYRGKSNIIWRAKVGDWEDVTAEELARL